MFLLTNEQRACFALEPVEPGWTCVPLARGRSDDFDTYLFVHDHTVKKCVTVGERLFSEADMEERLSDDGLWLLPKTTKGKLQRLSPAALLRRKGTGMHLWYEDSAVALYNAETECDYYSSIYDPLQIPSIAAFQTWVRDWCAATTEADRCAVAAFAGRRRRHVSFREGDVFRYSINRRLFGYGRILLDYDRMRKLGIPFWDVLMMKPLAVSVYRIATEREGVSLEELAGLGALPSCCIADNAFYYGEYPILGNLPVDEATADYPILYGDGISVLERSVNLQMGKAFYRIPDGAALYPGFRNNGVGFLLNVRLPVLQACIAADSNAPYWNQERWASVNGDLRNPKFKKELDEVCAQFQIPCPSRLRYSS